MRCHTIAVVITALALALAGCPERVKSTTDGGDNTPPHVVCPTGKTSCAGHCVDVASDAEHCGECDHACTLPGAQGACTLSTCGGWSCLPGRVDSDGDLSNGCEGSCSNVAITADGALDYDLRVVTISGTVTVDGAQPSTVGAGSRGQLLFQRAGGGRPATVSLPASSAAIYQIKLIAGTYAITLDQTASCGTAGALPCGSTLLRRGQALNADGVLDLDVASSAIGPGETFEISGRVTVNGQAVATSRSGGQRGRIAFVSSSGDRIEHGLGTSGEAVYTVRVAAGSYDVVVDNATDCPDGALPCQRRTARKALALSAAGVLDVDLHVVSVVGHVTVNGSELGASATAGSRGQLGLVDDDGGVTIDLGSSGSAVYQSRIFAGRYDVVVSNATDCPTSGDSALPCQSRAVRTQIALEGDGSLDLDLPVVSVSGTVTASGAALGASATGGVRGRLLFNDEVAAAGVPLGASGAASYRIKLYAGSYTLAVENSDDCPLDRPSPLPCQLHLISGNRNLTADGVLDVEVPVIQVNGSVDLDGAGMPNAASSRGLLVFAQTDRGEVRADLQASGSADYRVSLYPGHYQVLLDNTACQTNVLPCQRHALREIDLDASGSLHLDAPTVLISGQVTVNGGQMGDSPVGVERGRVAFTAADAQAVLAPVGASGVGTYQATLFPGHYDVGFVNTSDCSNGAVPCQRAALRSDLELAASGNLDLDLSVVTVSGRVTVNGATMQNSVSGQPRGELLLQPAASEPVSAVFGTSGAATWSTRLIAGEYGALFNGSDCPSGSSGAAPCQGALLAGCPQ